eukprot:720286-Ditylum_brightwellii.AAC.1
MGEGIDAAYNAAKRSFWVRELDGTGGRSGRGGGAGSRDSAGAKLKKEGTMEVEKVAKGTVGVRISIDYSISLFTIKSVIPTVPPTDF